MGTSRAAEPVLPGQLDHGSMLGLLGYHLAQATIPTNHTFKVHISDPHKLNKLEFTILMLLHSNGELTPKRLTTAMNIPASNMTIILDRLELRKLLTRVRSTEDRRVQQVHLTPAGSALCRKLAKTCESMEENILKHITAAEQKILFELLRKVAQHRKV